MRTKILTVVSSAYTVLQGEGELRVRAMAVLANRFGVQIPQEAVGAAVEEEGLTEDAMKQEQNQSCAKTDLSARMLIRSLAFFQAC